MHRILALALSLGLALPLAAQEATGAESAGASPVEAWLAAPMSVVPAKGLDLAAFKWRARPMVVFADSPFDPAFQEQMELIAEDFDQLAVRDVVVIADTDPAAQSAVRTQLRPRGFALVLIDKEGRVNLRKPFPWDVREMTHAIDKWPIRQQEIRDTGRSGG